MKKKKAKVLRALESQEIEAVGDVKPRKVDVRIISATNRNLEQAVNEGRLREDLYYRLNEIVIKMPPLRERKEDIPALTHHFLQQSCDEHNRCITEIDNDAMMRLTSYDWPGNIRQFRSFINKIVIFAESETISAKLLDALFDANGDKNENDFTFRHAMQESEKQIILNALIANDWNVTEAALALGLDRTNLHKKMVKLGINRNGGDR